MDERQQRILTRNLRFLSEKIRVGNVVEKTRELYPGVFTRKHLREIERKSGEPRVAYVIAVFKAQSDGYGKLFDVLKDTRHGDTVLNVLRPGLNLQTGGFASASSQGPDTDAIVAALGSEMKSIMLAQEKRLAATIEGAMQTMKSDLRDLRDKINKLDDLDKSLRKLEEGLTSETKSKEELQKIVSQLVSQIAELRNKITEIEKRDDTLDTRVVDKVVEKLNKMEKRFGMSEIDEIRKELRQVRDWTKQQCGDIRERMTQFERRSSETELSQGSVAIAESDAKKIAVKIKTTWEVIARDVGIEGEKIKHSRGSHELTGEAAAEAFITQWIQMSAEKSTTPSTPPTWDSLYNIASRHNKTVAKELQDLRKLSK